MLPSRFGNAAPIFIQYVGLSLRSMTARTLRRLRPSPPFDSFMSVLPRSAPRVRRPPPESTGRALAIRAPPRASIGLAPDDRSPRGRARRQYLTAWPATGTEAWLE